MEKTNKANKTSWFKEMKAEFNKIIWPTKERIVKETVVVVICAIIIGIIVAVLDMGIQYGIQALVG
ncbi:preprotein translocase subunit SecE [Anaerostipes sp. MSJ-23]|uniref:preprotein translocase subunit SecE n=1 Tax=unclassified Anaerostipes TaxID=2635253 RepID=UPI001C0F68D3|nr:preprotein translocase subunit SecE [Anaerostipes sp. MSJ-23]MBU5459572.1 preprotein translocase subunit SecE [Anaerostipes sp. MSJ-23]